MADRKIECVEFLDSAVELIKEMRSMLTEGGEDSDAAGFLEASHEAIGRINYAVSTALLPLLEGSPDESEGITLEIYRATSGQWAGRFMSGGEEIGGIAGYDSPEAVKAAATDSSVYPDRTKIIAAEG